MQTNVSLEIKELHRPANFIKNFRFFFFLANFTFLVRAEAGFQMLSIQEAELKGKSTAKKISADLSEQSFILLE